MKPCFASRSFCRLCAAGLLSGIGGIGFAANPLKPGSENLWLTFTGKAGELIRLDWREFSPN